MRILVTGARGFVGRSILKRLMGQAGVVAIGAGRNENELPDPEALQQWVRAPELDAGSDWRAVLSGVDAVIHSAGRAHMVNDAGDDDPAQYRRINRDGTLALARQAAQAGVRRFVFLSSIHVNGLKTQGKAFTETSPVLPLSPYALSKYEAEQALMELAGEGTMEIVIVRPPLVYGPDAPGNLRRLANLVARGLPLPFASVRNARSLVHADNLADLLALSTFHAQAANEIFLAADGKDLTTGDIVRHMAADLNVPARLFACPPALLRVGLSAIGKATMADQLLSSLQVDISKARDVLGWVPPYRPDTVRWL